MTRTEYDGPITVILDRFEGKRLNSPNDIVVKSDDSIWFTDPPFGILGHYEGHAAEARAAHQRLPRRRPRPARRPWSPATSNRPNGLCFSPDERRLYVVESGASPRRIRVFDVSDDGRSLLNDRVFLQCRAGRLARRLPLRRRRQPVGRLGHRRGPRRRDGIRARRHAHRPHRLPERCANLCFGGAARNRLFMAASQSLYALYVNTQGARGG